MSGVRVYVSQDSAACSVGADEVAVALLDEAARRGIDFDLRRNGSRGMLWLEPLVEGTTPSGRVAYGPVTVADLPSLWDAGLIDGHPHPLALGPVDQTDWFRRQTRDTFGRCGATEPLSWDDYRAHGGWTGLERARSMGPDATIEEVVLSGLRGRGGAGFPAGVKWRTTAAAPGARKYVVCNADEGDSGTFADRMLIEGDPFLLIEGMVICALAIGANRGVIYLRSEYPDAVRVMREAVRIGRAQGLLGPSFDLDVRVGAGAYVCGEETALLESLEGRRGQVRAKPPLPAHRGLFGQPTVVNNVLTLAAVPSILTRGGRAYAAFGIGRSRGTMPFQIAGNVLRGGLFEVPFGMSLRELVEDVGGGTATGRPVRAVQVGGPLGAYFPDRLLDVPLDYEAMLDRGGILGHGGVVVFDDRVDMAKQARFAFQFCAAESCGKCTPCRIGSTRGVETIDRIIAGTERQKNVALTHDLLTVMTDGSLCALGGLTALPVGSALQHFPEDFGLEAAQAAVG